MRNTNNHDLPWHLEEIDFSAIDPAVAARNEDLVVLLCASSFIESGSDLYSNNLSAYFDGDAELVQWLEQQWEVEELQHGRALKTYIAHVWPDFDWEASFARFFIEYSPTCKIESFEKTRALELVARCVVETGTASLYRAIHELTDEPVLKALTANIRSDEVRHYKYFLRHFKRYSRIERSSRWAVLGAIIRRTRELKSEDSDIALRHVFASRYKRSPVDNLAFDRMSRSVNALVKRNLSADMCLKMLVKPLDLPNRMQAIVLPAIGKIAQRLFFR